jgi:hypothetical protein
VMGMVRRGMMRLEEARHHPDKNILLGALGTQLEASVATQKEPFPVRDGDHFALRALDRAGQRAQRPR